MLSVRRLSSAAVTLELAARGNLGFAINSYTTRFASVNHLYRQGKFYIKRRYGTANPADHDSTDLVEAGRIQISEALAEISNVSSGFILRKLRSNTSSNFDFSFPVPSLTVQGKHATAEHALEWAEKFPALSLVERPVAANTLLKFKLKTELLARSVISRVLSEKDQYGANSELGLKDPMRPLAGRKKVLVEFSSPNIAKPFHAGHLRSTVIGGFIANAYEAAGWDVVRYNFLGDWGLQFGLLAVGFERYGDDTKLTVDPIGHLFEVYVQVNKVFDAEDAAMNSKAASYDNSIEDNPPRVVIRSEMQPARTNSTRTDAQNFFKRLEDGEPHALSIWQKFRKLSIEKYEETYARLNINYDCYAGESGVDKRAIDTILQKLVSDGVCKKEAHGLLIDFDAIEGRKRLGKTILQKRDGTSIYLGRDLGEAIHRNSAFQPEKMIYVIASQQDRHMMQLMKLLEVAGYPDIAAKSSHVTFGIVKGMSTRKGTVKFLDDILEEAATRMHGIMTRNQSKYSELQDPKSTAESLGISAVVIQDLKGRRSKDYVFDFERMTRIEGDTGPHLQYVHARLCSIARKSGVSINELFAADLTLLKEIEARNVLRVLSAWPSTFRTALDTHEPSTVVQYLFKLAQAINSFYHALHVLDNEPGVKLARLALCESARQVLSNGLKLLGLAPLSRV